MGLAVRTSSFGGTECGYSEKLGSGDFFSQPCFNDPCPQSVLSVAMWSPWETDHGAPATSGPLHTPMCRHTVDLPEQI